MAVDPKSPSTTARGNPVTVPGSVPWSGLISRDQHPCVSCCMSGWEWLDSGTSGGRSPDPMSVFFSGEVVPLCSGLVFGICCGESHLLFLGLGACGLRVGVCSLCQRGVVAAVGWSWLLLGAPLPPCRGSRCLLRRAACLSFAWLSAFVPPAGG